MKGHFDRYLNVKELLIEHKPKVVVECGAGSGENTRNLLSLRDVLDYRLIVINDDGPAAAKHISEFYKLGVDWRSGISYKELPHLANVDFCLIDTDHNYWTLKRELMELWPVTSKGGICVIHDTATYAKDSGRMCSYNTPGAAYPHDQIVACEQSGLGMADAIDEEIAVGRWRKIKETHESHGAVALEKL